MTALERGVMLHRTLLRIPDIDVLFYDFGKRL
jgi:hypothetical protein